MKIPGLVLSLALAISCLTAPAEAAPRTDIVLGMGIEPAGLDPTIAAPVAIGQVTWQNVFEGLVTIDRDGKIRPQLAESWEISSDGLTYTFKLRQNVAFHDGSAFDSGVAKAALDRARGALVASVTDGSPAEKAGLRAGDLVVSADAVDVDDPPSLNYRLVTKGIGSSVELGVIRAGKADKATIALEAAPEIPPRDERLIDIDSPFAGATVVNLSPAVIADLGYKGRRSKGVLVEKVADGSIASQVGFQAGDVIVEVNGVPVDATRTLADLARQRFDLWRLAIERDGRLIRSTIGG